MLRQNIIVVFENSKPSNWCRIYLLGLCLPSLVPRPPPRLYLAAVEKSLRDKVWAEAWERGYVYPPACMCLTQVEPTGTYDEQWLQQLL